MKQTLLSLLLLVLLSSGLPAAQAQQLPPDAPRQTHRLELELQTYSSDVQVLALPQDSSAVLLIEREPRLGTRSTYSFQKLDHALHTRWTKDLVVPERYYFNRMCSEGTMVYALFQDEYLGHKMWIAALNSRTGEIRSTTYDTKISHEIFDLKALDGNLFLTVQVEQHLTLLLLRLRSGEYQLLPAVYESIDSQLTVLADSVARQLKLVVTQTNGVKSRLQVKQLSAQGQLLHSEFVQAESNRSLLTAQISTGDSTDRLLAGTYTLRDTRYSQGIFATDLTQLPTPTGSRPSLRFYDFQNLKHFFDFMSPGRQARLRRRSARRQAAAREFRLHYRLLMHDLLPTPEGYALVAEIYFPQYHYSNYGFGFMNTPRMAGGPRNFDGYRTTHAIVCGFDRRGNLLWDNSFVLEDVETQRLEETMRVRPLADGRRFVLAYLDEDEIHYKVIDRTAPASNDLLVPIQTTMVPGAKEKSTSVSHEDMQPWYGGRFLAFGYQHVRNGSWSGRDVFFLNTVDFD